MKTVYPPQTKFAGGRGGGYNYIEFRPVVQEEMLFEDTSYLELWWPLLFSGANFLCNCGRGHYKEDFCETISSLHQRLRRCCLKNHLEL